MIGPRIRLFHILTSLALVVFFAERAAAGPIGFVYALQQVNGGTNQIHGFRFDQTTGALTRLAGFPMSSQGTGTNSNTSEQLAFVNGRLFVVNDGDNTLAVFSVNLATGALTALPFSPIALGVGTWTCAAVHASGSPVVVGNNAGTIASFVVTDLTATAAAGSPFTTGTARPFSCRFSQDGASVYAGGSSGTTIAGFSVNAGTGVLTPLTGSPFEAGAGFPLAYATDTSGRLFSSTLATGGLRAYTTAAGVPTGVSANPFPSGLGSGIHGLVHPGGFYMVADRSGNRVGVYQIAGADAATTLTAVAGSPFTSGGTFTDALALTSTGAHLVAANGASRNLTLYQVDQSTGALTLVSVQAANTLGTTGLLTGLAFAAADAGFVYSLTQVQGGANQIYGFRVDSNTGVLNLLPGFPVSSGGIGGSGSFSEHIAHLRGRLYVINEGSANLSAFTVNRTTGALTALPFSPLAVGGDLSSVVVHPSGSPVVVAGNAGVSSFNVTATTATAAAGSPFATPGASPFACALSVDGSAVYTGGNVGTGIAGFAVDQATGVLTPLAGSPFDSGAGNPVGYAADGAGRLFVSNFGSGVRAFTTSSGIPTAVTGNPFASGLSGGVRGILNPLGFYMVADRSANRIGVFQVAGSGAATTLTAVPGSPFAVAGSFTAALTQTTDGGFVVAANGVSRNLSVYQVNPATGVLTNILGQPVNTLGAAGLVTGVTFAAVVPPFLDDPLTAMTSVIKAAHILDLRTRVDGVRALYGLGLFPYTDPTLTVAATQVRAAHVNDLRAALAEVYVALGMAAPGYTDPTLSVGATVVKLVHIAQLRAAVLAVE